MPIPFFRLLLIEDDKLRVERFQSWLPKNTRLVTATSAGSALGILERDPPGTYGGIMLDHDLQQQTKTNEDTALSGSNLVTVIIRTVARSVAILIHSMNITRARAMAERLDRSGYWVTRISMDQLTESQFRDWVEEAREIWEDGYR